MLLFPFVITYGWWCKIYYFLVWKTKLSASTYLWLRSPDMTCSRHRRLAQKRTWLWELKHIGGATRENRGRVHRWPRTQRHPERLFKTINSNSRWAETNNRPFRWELVPRSLSKSSKQSSPSWGSLRSTSEHTALQTQSCFVCFHPPKAEMTFALLIALPKHAGTWVGSE